MLMILLVAVSVVSVGCKKDKIEKSTAGQTYAAVAEQSGTDAPVMNELENSIGAIEWEYVSPGVYHGRLPGAFPLDKTFVLCNNGVDGFISGDIRHWDPDFVEFRTFAGFDAAGNPKPSNGCAGISFEIRVYD